MIKNWLTFRNIALLILISSLCSCASVPPCKNLPIQLSPVALATGPLPQQFSKCLREIEAVGRREQAQISALCSKLLEPALIKSAPTDANSKTN